MRKGPRTSHRLEKAGAAVQGFLESLGGTQVGPIKFPEKKDQPDGYWKKLLTTPSRIWSNSRQPPGNGWCSSSTKCRGCWPQSPIRKRDGEQTAMEVLDVLRACASLRPPARASGWCCAGRSGMHHVLGELKQQGYKNQPVNDMTLVEVPPLDHPSQRTWPPACSPARADRRPEPRRARSPKQTGGFPLLHPLGRVRTAHGRPISDSRRRSTCVVKKLLTAAARPLQPPAFPRAHRRILSEGREESSSRCSTTPRRARPHLARRNSSTWPRRRARRTTNQVRELLRLLGSGPLPDRDTEGATASGQPCSAGGGSSNRGLN